MYIMKNEVYLLKVYIVVNKLMKMPNKLQMYKKVCRKNLNVVYHWIKNYMFIVCNTYIIEFFNSSKDFNNAQSNAIA